MNKIFTRLIMSSAFFLSNLVIAAPEEIGSPAASSNPVVQTEGAVQVGPTKLNYQTTTGTLDLYNSDPDDPITRMFYVAYFKKQEGKDENRPITFIYNGGPGSASLWLHIGALGPKRVVPVQPQQNQNAPYQLINNEYSLLNASDLVFIDAPGTGYSRFISHAPDRGMRDQQKSQRAGDVYSINGDADAFAQFIQQFLTQYQRWNSPRYLLGESYGTTRSAVLAQQLKNQYSIDLNGIVLMSQFLSLDNSIDDPELNPGFDQPYYLALPTYAATAWYHKTLPQPHNDQQVFLQEVEKYALGAYAQALMQGSSLPEKEKAAVAAQLYQYTGIPAESWIKANLRLNGPEFEKKLLSNKAEIVGRIDTRYSGASLDAAGGDPRYDPSNAIISGFVSSFNNYVMKTLKFSTDTTYQVFADVNNFNQLNTGTGRSFNVLPDLARAMTSNPSMKVLVIGGIYDLATPYFTAQYEMRHLPIAPALRNNISFSWYPTGHMPYLDEPSLKRMHAELTTFMTK